MIRIKSGSVKDDSALQSDELEAMRRMVTVSRNTFSLSIAVCNSPVLRDYLISRVRDGNPGIKVISVPAGVTDTFGYVCSHVGDGSFKEQQTSAVFVTGLERILVPEGSSAAIRSLNASRELWERHFHFPVVLWVPEFVAILLSSGARDLWRYRSHRFEFVANPGATSRMEKDSPLGQLSIAANLSQDEKYFRIAELEQRLKDTAGSGSLKLDVHVSRWLNELGALYFQIGQMDEAQRTWQTLGDMAKLAGSQADVSYACGNIGILLRRRGDLNGAEAMLREALRIDEDRRNLPGLAAGYGNLGIVFSLRGDPAVAESMFRTSLEIAERTNCPEYMATAYANLGIIFSNRRDWDSAERMFRKSLAIEEQLGRFEGMASDYGNIANINGLRGNLDAAEALYRKALQIQERLGLLPQIAVTYANIGTLELRQGNFEKADALFKKALEINSKIGQVQSMADDYDSLGAIDAARNDVQGAIEKWQKSIELYTLIGAQEPAARVQHRIAEAASKEIALPAKKK